MRVLIAGAENPLAKAFVKANKKKMEIIALDTKAGDFSDYTPVREIFKAYKFDAVLYFTAAGSFGKKAVFTGDLNLLKNLAYACATNGRIRMIITADADEGNMFGAVAAGMSAKNGAGLICLRVFGLIGKGYLARINPLMKLLTDANKTGAVNLTRDRKISMIHCDDALRVVNELIGSAVESGCFDLVAGTKPNAMSTVAKTAGKLLEGGVTVSVLNKTPAADYTGNPEPLKAVLPKFRFTAQNAAIEKVLGNV